MRARELADERDAQQFVTRAQGRHLPANIGAQPDITFRPQGQLSFA
ncbi:MAG: hypothetical protein OXE81_03260 [Gammaproteobacteria bacterium]|nr:hypothetical protein [Gammaproteobacteria bacterium]MCY4276843.1 hypothetical protein [Gammaproteobacteria bacterium]